MQKKMTLVPCGGIGNRIGTIASAVQLAEKLDFHLRVFWFKDWGMKVGFNDLFEPIANCEILSPTFSDYIVNDLPRKKNFYLPAPFQGIMYDKCFYGDKRYIDTDDILGAQKVYIATCYEFFPGENDYSFFAPSKKVVNIMDSILMNTVKPLVGVQIRRGDHIVSIEKCPTSLFIERMEEEPSDTLFYLATDSLEVKNEISEKFKGRVITNPQTLLRGTQDAELQAAAEMFILSKCSKIIGSYQSSFGLRASQLGNIDFKCVTGVSFK